MTRFDTLCAAWALSVFVLPAAAEGGDPLSLSQLVHFPKGRQIIGANDGWASTPTTALPEGTTGGSAAAPENVYLVTNRNELVAALAFPSSTPKLIYVKGTIDANVDAQGNPLTCESYYRADPSPPAGEPPVTYSLEAFLAQFDPAGPWGRVNPSGPLERARAASAAAQAARVRIRIPANTTLYGIGANPTIRGAWFDIRPSSTSGNQPMNVIIRNLSFEDTVDCFPVWAPNDGAQGNWNSAYDSISVRNATHVWVDHNRFADVTSADHTLPVLFGRVYQVHDGHLDVTNESDLVTISFNKFLDHDKTMLIGSSDGATADRNKLRVTLHHNLFENVGQRVPRVRFGQVHVYNNLFRIGADTNYGYSWGVGIESQIYAENNAFEIDASMSLADVIDRFNGTRITDIGNCVVTGGGCALADFVGAWNAANDPDLIPDAGWAPTLYGKAGAADRAKSVPVNIPLFSGPNL
jgi:pectate lyase